MRSRASRVQSFRAALSGGRQPLRIAYSTTSVSSIVGQAESITVSASGGAPPITYAVQSGALPDGLSLDANTGSITGTYTLSGSFSAVIRATDSRSKYAEFTITWVIIDVPIGFFTSAGYCANEWV